MNCFDLTGKKAIVTGASGGLGYGIAEALCQAGAAVVMIDVNPKVEERARDLNARAICADLLDNTRLEGIFQQATQLLDGLDILVNNAGILHRSPFEAITIEQWNHVLELNLNVVFRLCQLAGKIMRPQKYGKIINIASMLSFFGGYTVASYAASKGAVIQLTKAISNEWSKDGICVNAIAPGYMNTPINTKLVADPARSKEILTRIPAGRWGLPEDVGGAAVFLASQASDYIRGAVVPVDGGYLAR